MGGQGQLRSLTSPGTVSSATAPGKSHGLTPKLSSMSWERELRRPSSSLQRPPFWWLPAGTSTPNDQLDDKASRQAGPLRRWQVQIPGTTERQPVSFDSGSR